MADVGERVVFARGADDAGEQRALLEVQVLGRLVEVEPRRGADPVDVVREEDLIQVELEDLVLGVVLLDPLGEGQLLELPGDRLVVRIGLERVLHELLRDRRAALDDAAGADVRDRRADQREDVDRAMVIEPGVLRREHRLLRPRADLVQRHDLAVVQIDVREHGLAVGRVDRRALRQVRDLREFGARRVEPRLELLDPHARGEERRRDQDGEQRRGRDEDGEQQEQSDRLERPAIADGASRRRVHGRRVRGLRVRLHGFPYRGIPRRIRPASVRWFDRCDVPSVPSCSSRCSWSCWHTRARPSPNPRPPIGCT